MMALDLLWWLGWLWFAAWTAAPLLLVPYLGAAPGVLVWAALAPWSALIGMAATHRLLPRSEPGKFRLFADRGAVRWALKGWAPSVYLSVFQPVWFASVGFQRVVLRAFGARLGAGTQVTTRTVIREPHHVQLGAGTLVGEFVHLAPAYQPRLGLLVVDNIVVGDGVLIGAHGVVAPGVRIGHRCILEHSVVLGPAVVLGDSVRVGGGSVLYTGVHVGDRAVIGKGCILAAGVVIAAGAVVPDGAMVSA